MFSRDKQTAKVKKMKSKKKSENAGNSSKEV